MFYLIYKTTNLINGKIYIGSHRTTDINDSYMGSGKYLLYALKKYGIENFKKEILFIFDNAKDMYSKEAELVNETFLSEENTYNLKLGGFGGFSYINNTGKNLYGKNGQPGYGGQNLIKGWNRDKTDDELVKISKTLREGYSTGRLSPTFLGKKHKLETIEKLKGHTRQNGEKNSQYGTCWVTHPKLGNKKIGKQELDKYLQLGYNRGRKMKKETYVS